MQKPSSIKITQIILYVKLLLIVFLALSGVLSIVASAINVICLAAILYAIYKRKRMLSFIFALVVLYFSPDIINMALSFVVVILLFTRSSRSYFAGDAASTSGAPEAPAEEDSIEAEGYAVTEADEDDAEGVSQTANEEGTPDESERSEDEPAAENRPTPARTKPSADPVVEIREAGAEDAEIVHGLMMEAFEEYRAAVPPSSALSETVESVRAALESKSESAAILTEDGIPAAMVRFRLEDNAIYFFRLSVRLARRKRGYARKLVEWVELRGRSQGKEFSRCKVRQTVSRNLVLYENMGYVITDQELVVRPEGSVKALTMEKRLMNY